jgi:hypothetical protein
MRILNKMISFDFKHESFQQPHCTRGIFLGELTSCKVYVLIERQKIILNYNNKNYNKNNIDYINNK